MGNKICGGTATKTEPDEEYRVQETLENLFPNFKPVAKGDPKWQVTEGANCPECAHAFDFLTSREHCRSCGHIYCSRCCYARKAIHDHCICGVCMGSAMKALRERELSKLEIRVRTHSQLLRERERRNSQISQRGSTVGGDAGENQEMGEVKKTGQISSSSSSHGVVPPPRHPSEDTPLKSDSKLLSGDASEAGNGSSAPAGSFE